ncbi:hypothetical protein A6A40_25735 (plasmid) [Azospirillum humicireducens]|uniref:DUF4398 domain-containing protein n=1 Tax=Azospirillum humicireducens TaxID=1226968 RepID=A0A2R4VVE5_9PROT|nr:hypothetical protein [Azospirillum humicireducens]AWB08420.1 hypothetical protein A6A40_25735 [Azospirillum humicireducens]
MVTQKFATVAVAATLSLSALTFAAGSANAAQDAGFDSLLASTAAVQADSPTAERSERDAARTALSVARSLAAQGDTKGASAYLAYARAKLGLGSTVQDSLVGLSASGDAAARTDAIASHSSYR